MDEKDCNEVVPTQARTNDETATARQKVVGDDDSETPLGCSESNNRSTRRRGWRPHSQRNRKRPRAPQKDDDMASIVAQAQVIPLPLIEGKQVVKGLVRIIKPYPYTYATYAKARWIGRTVLDVYHTEFGSYPEMYYREAIEKGRIKVCDKMVDPSYQVQGGDVLTHTVHRHEPAVAVSIPDKPFVTIVTETKDLVVVDKPGTLPIHACGGYHLNALMPLLEPYYGKLYTIHRLDRLTSGLVLLAKSSAVAQQWAASIQQRSCQKVYLARVKGKFPTHCPSSLSLLRDQSQVPRGGEWPKREDTNNNVSDDSVAALRQKHAVACWIIDSTGSHRPDVEELSHLIPSKSLSDDNNDSYRLQDWMKHLPSPPNGTTPSESTTTTTTSKTTIGRNMLWMTLACPTRVAQHKDGICEAGSFDELDDDLYRKTVKPAQTSFAVLRYDETTDSTVVLCRPETGRTHQIRLHLQYLGHPIANDPNYGGEIWYADRNGQAAYQYARTQLDDNAVVLDDNNNDNVMVVREASSGANDATSAELWNGNVQGRLQQVNGAPTTTVPATEAEMSKLARCRRNDNESAEDFIQRTCVWCSRSRGGDVNHTLLEFLVRSRGIWLHAIQYSVVSSDGELVSYATDPPDWS